MSQKNKKIQNLILSCPKYSLTLSRMGGGEIDPNFFKTSFDALWLNVSC